MRLDDEDDEPVTVSGVEVLKKTAKALLVEVKGDEVWLPRSELLDGTTVENEGDEGEIEIPAWLARDRGLA